MNLRINTALQFSHIMFKARIKPVILAFSMVLFISCGGDKKPKIGKTEASKQASKQSAYLMDLPLDIMQVAEEYKATFVNNKLADQEIIEEKLTPEQIQRQYEVLYEKAINTLYINKKADKKAFEQIVILIKYTPTLFDNALMRKLLNKKSPVLADFALHYQVQTAINKTDRTAELEAQSKTKDQVIAEQQSKINVLSGKVSTLKANEVVLNQKLETVAECEKTMSSLKKQLAQAETNQYQDIKIEAE